MSRTRYEPVPQRDEVINLDSIAGYNYNSGVPNSIPSSAAPSYYGSDPRSHSSNHHHAPSIRSIPTSPPPSFHTHSSPGTPRPTPSTTAAGDYAELWGVAPSTIGGTEMSHDPHTTITLLQARIQKLEESVGRLLLEKDEREPEKYNGGNCCMSYTDASKSLETGMSAAGGNCCIHFRSSTMDERLAEQKGKKFALVIIFGILTIICTMIVLLALVKRGKGFPAAEGVGNEGLKAD